MKIIKPENIQKPVLKELDGQYMCEIVFDISNELGFEFDKLAAKNEIVRFLISSLTDKITFTNFDESYLYTFVDKFPSNNCEKEFIQFPTSPKDWKSTFSPIPFNHKEFNQYKKRLIAQFYIKSEKDYTPDKSDFRISYEYVENIAENFSRKFQ